MSVRPVLAAAATAATLFSLAACGTSSTSTTAAGQPSAAAGGKAGGQGTNAQSRMPGVSGKIAAKQGTTLQVQNQSEGQVAVTYSSSTTITAEVSAALSDVKVGRCVTVMPAASSGSSTSQTSITAGTVRISDPVKGSCTGGFGGGGGFARGGGQGGGQTGSQAGGQSGGQTGGQAGTMPSGAPSGRPSGMAGGTGGFAGGRGLFASGKVTAVSGSGFTVASVTPGSSSTRTVTVTVGGTTTYTQTKASGASALTVGACVFATGQTSDTGAVTARRIVVSSAVDGTCTTGFGGGRGQRSGSTTQQGGAS